MQNSVAAAPTPAKTYDPVVVVDPRTGLPGGGFADPVALLTNADTTGEWSAPLPGGIYNWNVDATWNGDTATLQRLHADGSTAVSTSATLTANGVLSVEIGQGARVRVLLPGSAVAAYSSLARVQ